MTKHFTGMIMHSIRAALNLQNNDMLQVDHIMLDNIQSNSFYGIYQGRVRLHGDDQVYRLILAPADVPIKINTTGVSRETDFAKPLGDC